MLTVTAEVTLVTFIVQQTRYARSQYGVQPTKSIRPQANRPLDLICHSQTQKSGHSKFQKSQLKNSLVIAPSGNKTLSRTGMPLFSGIQVTGSRMATCLIPRYTHDAHGLCTLSLDLTRLRMALLIKNCDLQLLGQTLGEFVHIPCVHVTYHARRLVRNARNGADPHTAGQISAHQYAKYSSLR